MNPCNRKINSFALSIRVAMQYIDAFHDLHVFTFNYIANSALRQISNRELICSTLFDISSDNSTKNSIVAGFSYNNRQVFGKCATCALYGFVKEFSMTGKYELSNNSGYFRRLELNQATTSCRSWLIRGLSYFPLYAGNAPKNNEFPLREGLHINGTEKMKLNIPNLSGKKTSQYCNLQSNLHIFNLCFGNTDISQLDLTFEFLETGSVGKIYAGEGLQSGIAIIDYLTIT